MTCKTGYPSLFGEDCGVQVAGIVENIVVNRYKYDLLTSPISGKQAENKVNHPIYTRNYVDDTR